MQAALTNRSTILLLASASFFMMSLAIAMSWGAGGMFFEHLEDQQLIDILLWDIRLPRVLLAALCGGSLASAGVVSQGLFRNALAGPSIMGSVSSANLCVVMLMYLGFQQEHWFIHPMAAVIGSLVSSLAVLYLVNKWSHRLLLIGFALNTMYSAMTGFILSLSLSKQDLSQSIVYWLMGGFNAKSWEHIAIALPWCSLGLCLSLYVSRQLNVLNLGDDIARTLGLSIAKLKAYGIIAMTLLIAGTVATAGGIGFVGLIIPHMTRLYAGMEHRNLVILSFFNGASLVVLADTASRCLWAPQEIQVGSILALIGSPIFIWLLVKSKGSERWG